MLIKFKPKVTIISLLFALLFLRLSYWQWERYQQKLPLVERLKNNLSIAVTPINQLPYNNPNFWPENLYRRIEVSGAYDFKHEMLLRNRRFEDLPGVFLITPLKILGTNDYVLVQRGFIPLSESDPTQRKRYQNNESVTIVGLVKPSKKHFTFLQPKDPPASSNNWIDAWLRIDLDNITKQLPYTILPIYLEALDPKLGTDIASQVVRSDETRDDMLVLTERMQTMAHRTSVINYPVSVVDPVIPPERHLGYVYEWAILALLAILFGFALQLKRTP